MRTRPVFFAVVELLLRAGVTTVAEAAFQDRVWRPGLEPLRALAQFRIVHCVVDDEVAFQRVRRRCLDNPVRRAHADRTGHDLADFARQRGAFDRISVEAPWMEVDTSEGYQPGLDEIVRFVNRPASLPAGGSRGGAADNCGQMAGSAVGVPLECGAVAPVHDGGEQGGDGVGVSGLGQRVADVLD